VRILLADDHALVREGLALTLGALMPDTDFIEAQSADEVRAAMTKGTAFDLILLDLFMPGTDNFSLLTDLCQKDPDLPVVVLSGSTDPTHMRKALDLGASGYIPKSSTGEVMLSALRLVLAGGIYVPPDMLRLPSEAAPREAASKTRQAMAADDQAEIRLQLTGRQLDVLACLAEGKSNKQIARDLDLSENTVKIHVAAILRALNVNNRTQAAMAAREQGLLPTS
jgi:DNA-binding NarL/FixJ family response regulator